MSRDLLYILKCHVTYLVKGGRFCFYPTISLEKQRLVKFGTCNYLYLYFIFLFLKIWFSFFLFYFICSLVQLRYFICFFPYLFPPQDNKPLTPYRNKPAISSI